MNPSAVGRAIEFERPIDVKTAARFLGISPSLVYAYVERKQIPHFRMMGRGEVDPKGWTKFCPSLDGVAG
jgi:predicted DNA-binding transcriptional regulator AlpA